MNFSNLRQHKQPWALVLLLALLWLTGWGQVHRVLHPAATVATVLADARHGQDHPVVHAGHGAGDGLCLLLDHLADGSAALGPALLIIASAPVRGLPEPRSQRASASHARLFDARGPPVFA